MKLKLSKKEQAKFFNNAQIFLAPVGLIYLGSFVAKLQDGLQMSDFVADTFVLGAAALYLGNAGIDYLRKLKK